MSSGRYDERNVAGTGTFTKAGGKLPGAFAPVKVSSLHGPETWAKLNELAALKLTG